ncbi:MAG: restriction endonuclease subunit S, partial [Xanthomonadaceae bacterium]|nr:restriction endonuclease subunit S [Xanthomonadaceae bacterium]
INIAFLEQYFATTKWHKFMLINGDQGARADRFAIGGAVFQQMPIMLPLQPEQTKIGELFQKLDRAIELQQQKVEQSERYKKAMLQKMFPQKGETKPQLRFEGFSGEWEKSKLGQLVAIFRVLVYKPENVVRDGSADSIRVLRSSNIDEDVLVLREDDVFVQSDAVNIENVKQGDILITAANGSSRLVGKHAVIKESLAKTVHGGFMLIARTDFPYFINAWMGAVEYQKMLQLAQGGNGAIGNLSKKILDNCEITLPKDIEEQTKIGEFFQALDERIEVETKTLNHYESLKKAMLQRMFV